MWNNLLISVVSFYSRLPVAAFTPSPRWSPDTCVVNSFQLQSHSVVQYTEIISIDGCWNMDWLVNLELLLRAKLLFRAVNWLICLCIDWFLLYLIHSFKSFDLISNFTELCVKDAFQKPCTLKVLRLLAIQQAEYFLLRSLHHCLPFPLSYTVPCVVSTWNVPFTHGKEEVLFFTEL